MTDGQKIFLLNLAHRYQMIIENEIGSGSPYADIKRYQLDNAEELSPYIPEDLKHLTDPSLDLLKVWLLLSHRNHSNNIPPILAYLEATKYSWGKGEYNLSNQCHRGCRNYDLHRRPFMTEISQAEEALSTFGKIFFDEEYGKITLFVFSYCLAALFRNRLTRSLAPLYLQIACEKNTVLHSLICEIVTICDLNSGIFENCTHYSPWSCGCNQHRTVYPLEVDRSIEHLMPYRNTPVIVDGYGSNTHNYRALLREVSNKTNKSEIDADGLLPIFMCREIKSTFNNFFNMDLSDVQVSDDYFDLVKENRVFLMSLVSKLSENFIESLFPMRNEEDGEDKYLKGIYPFAARIKNMVESIRGEYDIHPKYARNVGSLKFFFQGFLSAFSDTFNHNKFNKNVKFNSPIVKGKHDKNRHLYYFSLSAERFLVGIHTKHSHVPIDSIKVNIIEEAGGKEDETRNMLSLEEKKRITKKAHTYAIDIVRCYQKFGTPLIIKGITVKDRGGRYIYNVTVPEGVRRDKIFTDAEDVRGHMKVEYLRTDKASLDNTIVVSDKIPKIDNSLAKILASKDFNDTNRSIPFAVGHDIMGETFVVDLADSIHLFFGGSTGSGKSRALHGLILSLITKQSSKDVNLLIFDFGRTFLRRFEGVPHLSHKIVRDEEVAYNVIVELSQEMERRRKLDDDDLNAVEKEPRIYCIIDEFQHLIQHCGNDFEKMVKDLLARGRGFRIHMVLAVQDPTEKNTRCGVTNVGTILAFSCETPQNSMVMIKRTGAEKLLGDGDMLFKTRKGYRNIQGANMEDDELIEKIEEVRRLRSGEKPVYIIDETLTSNKMSKSDSGTIRKIPSFSAEKELDKDIAKVIMILFEEREISAKRARKAMGKSYDTVPDCIMALEKYNLIPLTPKNKPRKLKPKNIDAIENVVWEHLERYCLLGDAKKLLEEYFRETDSSDEFDSPDGSE